MRLKTFEEHIQTEDLPSLQLNKIEIKPGKFVALPSSEGKLIKVDIQDQKINIVDSEFKPNEIYDFVVLEDGTLMIGFSHYKLAGKSEYVKAAGELSVNEKGKINYLNNESGHYKPTKEDLLRIVQKFKEKNIISQNLKVQPRY